MGSRAKERRVAARAARARRLAEAGRLAMRTLLRPLALRGRTAAPPRRRLLLVQLDGVSRRRLEAAVDAGWMPAVAARLRSGRHVLASVLSGAPASTPAFQAGLFYGRSPSVPGFSWFDRATGREVRMDRAEDAAAVERRLSAGTPGLLRGGTAYFSIFSGGAALPHLCLSGLAGGLALEWTPRPFGAWDAAASLLAHGVTAVRGAVRSAHEAGAGLVDGLRWSLARGRLEHEPRFLAHRVLVGAVLRELAVQGILVDLSRGVPAVFVDLLAFDTTAHRRGPGAPAARRALTAMDRVLAILFAAADAVPELGYELVLLSDHGHVPTTPFEALAGAPLPAFVRRAEPGARVAVAEAGDLAHVYFLDGPAPLPLGALARRHPRALAALRREPAVGLLGVRGGARGLALVGGATLDLALPRDVARLPHPAPAVVARYLSDLLGLPESGDLVVQGWRGEGRPVVAYAWEFGSHGGVAPEELDCFVAHPAGVEFPCAGALRPSALHAWLEGRRRGGRAEDGRRGAAAP